MPRAKKTEGLESLTDEAVKDEAVGADSPGGEKRGTETGGLDASRSAPAADVACTETPGSEVGTGGPDADPGAEVGGADAGEPTPGSEAVGDEEVPGTEAEAEPDPDRKWYVVHTYSGYEAKVKANLEKRVESMLMQGKIFRIIVPTEDEIEYKDGRKFITKKKIFPGYVLVEMVMNDDSWYVVRNTPGVTGFVGSGAKPVALDAGEVRRILRHMGMDDPKPKVMYEEDESVKVVSGPFMGFIGKVREVNLDKGKLRVFVSMFGRETPVELDFSQVEKL